MHIRQADATQAEDRCYEIRRRAERKAAQLYAAMEKAKAGRPPKNRPAERGDSSTLSDLGIESQRMSEWRKLAGVPSARPRSLFLLTLASSAGGGFWFAQRVAQRRG
jgi:hypothetical protein